MDGITRYFNEMPMSYTDELMHYGVLGMKWGHHKARRLEAASAKQSLKGNTKKANQLKNRADAENRKYEHRKAFNEAYKADRKERRKYRVTKEDLNKMNNKEYFSYKLDKNLYGRKIANRITYEYQKRGKEGAAQERKKAIMGATLTVAATYALPAIRSKVNQYTHGKRGDVYVNNLAVEQYSRYRGGLNEYKKGGVNLGFKAADRGKKWMEAVRNAGK